MATAVFTNAEIDFVSAIGGGAAWNTVAAAWAGMNGDSGATSDAGVSSPILLVTGTLQDDATIPASIVIASIDITFDWSVTNVGGSGGTLTTILDRSAFVGRVTATQAVGTTTGTRSNTYHSSAYTGISTPTRADLFAAVFGCQFQLNDLTTTSTRLIISNYVVTVTYQNVGVGSWMVRGAGFSNATGATDFSGFPDIASVTGAAAVGGCDLTVGDVAGAFIYVDGSVTPVAVAGLPTGFVPADAYALNHATIILSLTGSVEYDHPTLFDFTVTGSTLPQLSVTQGAGGNEEFTGMDLTVLGSLIGDVITVTMTDSAGADGVFVQDTAAFAIDTAAYFVGTYTTVTPRVISVTPNKGTTSGGTAVTIRGEGFSAATGVEFDGTTLTDIVFVSDTVITGVTPQHISGSVDVEVLGVGTLADGYRYVVPRVLLPPIPVRSPLLQPGDASGG